MQIRFRFSALAAIAFLFLFNGAAYAAADDGFSEHDKHLPWTAGEDWALTSGYDEDAHTSTRTRFMLDFARRFPDGSGQAKTFNQPVLAIGDGTVTKVYLGGYDGLLGNYVKISHGNGYETRYDHLNSVSVAANQEVTRGQEVGRAGNTGFSAGYHMQVTLWKNGALVPLEQDRPVQGTDITTGETPINSFFEKTDDFFVSDNITEPPGPTRIFSIRALSCNNVRLTWQAAVGRAGYRIFRNGEEIDAVGPNTQSYNDRTVAGGTRYSYSVEAFNEWGTSIAEGALVETPACEDGTPPPPAPPAAPQLLSVTANSCSAIALAWTDVAGENLYRIFRNGSLLNEVPANTVDYTDTNVTAETSYNYFVRAANGGGSSPGSNILAAETPACPPPPPAPPRESALPNEWRNGVDVAGGAMGDPVNSATGNFYSSHVDLSVQSPGMPVRISRTYNSTDQRAASLGQGWQFGYDMRIIDVGNGQFAVKLDDGKAEYFQRDGNNFTTVNPRTVAVLSMDGEDYVYKTKQQKRYRFNAWGKLTEISDRNGNTMKFKYDEEDNKLTSFADTAGRTYTVSWDGNRLSNIADPSGRSVRYTYDLDGNLTAVTTPRGVTKRYEYAAAGKLSAAFDGNGNMKVGLEYDSDGRVRRLINPNASANVFDYQNNNHTVQTDERGGQLTYVHDENRRLIRMTDQLGGNEEYSYDAQDNLSSYKDRNGNVTRFAYDGRGNVTRIEKPNGYAQTLSYNTFDKPNSVADFTGAVRFDYDGRGNPVKITDQSGNETALTNNPRGLPETVRDPLGSTMRFTYDAAGNMTNARNPEGRDTQFFYDNVSRTTRIIDANSGAVAFSYDAESNRISMTDPRGSVKRFAYDNNGNLKNVIDEAANSVSFAYDASDLLIERTDYAGNPTRLAYDVDQNPVRQTDANGNITQHSYDLAGRRVITTLPEGGVIRYEYDGNDNVTKVTDPNGNATKFFYNSTNALARIENSLGASMIFDRDLLDRVTKITDFNSNTRVFTYDALSRVIGETTVLGGDISYTYDPVGNLIRLRDPLGRETKYEFNSLDQLVKIEDAAAGITRFEYDAIGNLARSADQKSNETSYQYDSNKNLAVLTDALGNVTSYEYDPRNLIKKITDANGHIARFEYDKNSRLLKRFNPNNGVFEWQYDANGNVLQTKNENSAIEQFTYDKNNRLTRSVDPLGHIAQFAYDASGNLLTNTDPRGNSVNYMYDSLNRLTKTLSAEGIEERFVYDALGNITEHVNGKGGRTGFAYDANSNLLSVTDPIGHATHSTYDLADRLISDIDAAGNNTAYSYNALDRLSKVMDALGGATQYAYDPVSNLLLQTDANGNATAFEYDALNRLVKEQNPLGNTWQYSYDPVGNVTSRVDANGDNTEYAYDKNDYLTATAYPDPSQNVSYSYDPAGNLTSMLDPNGTSEFTYDAADRLVGQKDAKGYRVGFEYDANYNRTKIIYPNAKPLTYAYDRDNRVISATDWQGLSAKFAYDRNDNLIEEIYPNNTRVTYAYDAVDRLAEKKNIARGQAFETYNFKYDPINNIVEEQRLYGKKRERGPVESATNTITYAYDNLSRLTGVSDTAGKIASYTYDPVGNRLSQINNRNFDLIEKGKGKFSSNTPETVAYEYNATNQLLEDSVFSYEYDPNGNRASKQRKGTDERFEYFYDFENRLNAVEAFTKPNQSEITAYLYDGLGRRVQTGGTKQTGNQTAIINSVLVAAKGGNSDNSPGNSGNAPGQQDTPPGLEKEHGKPDTPPGLEKKDENSAKGKSEDKGKNKANEKGQRKNKQNTKKLFEEIKEKSSKVKPAWYVYDQFGFDPVAEIRFPNQAMNGAGKQLHLRRANGRLYSQEIFSGDTGDDNDADELKELGRYQYFYGNHRGDITSMLKHNGQSLHSYLYDEFGQLYDNNQKANDNSNFTKKNDYTYSGKEFDTESELSYFGARYYDRWSGTWMTQDTYRGSLPNPSTLHRYGYVENNPINLVDRYGFSHEEFIQQYGTRWRGSIDAYVAEVERLHLTHPAYAKAKEREQRQKELEEIINSFDVTEEEKGYLKRSLGQLVKGNYTEDVTLLGTAGQVGTGLIGIDLPGDVRDITYDVTNWKWSWGHAGQTSLDTIGLLPIVGALKYTDETVNLAKGAKKAAKVKSLVGKDFGKLGKIISNAPGEIRGFRKHGLNQIITRGVTPAALIKTVKKPLAVLEQSGGTQLFLSDEAVVVLNKTGEVVTAYSKEYFEVPIKELLQIIK